MHGFCLSLVRMSKGNTYWENTFEVMHLLEEILDGFSDEYCRPTDKIALYEKYLQLRRTHDAKLVRHLIVISGGRASKPLARKDPSAQKSWELGKAHTTASCLTSERSLSSRHTS